MTGDEWLNIQDIFALFLGRWIVSYLAVALFGAVAKTIISFLWRRPVVVQILGRDDDSA